MPIHKLPDDFLIGTANSAFQSEGAYDRDGKSISMMDYYAIKCAGEEREGETFKITMTKDITDRGCFFYDNYEKYIDDMKETGQNTYRMSLSWCRIIPNGIGEVNQKGIDFYNKVINKLLQCGIEPFVDLYHWDMPMCLEEQGGFTNPNFPDWFENYAKVCFENFGDRVKLWSTFNETDVSLRSGYGTNFFPPYRASLKDAVIGNHICLLAHFRAVKLYKSLNLDGKIGAVNCIMDILPMSNKQEDLMAVKYQTYRLFDWILSPMMKGEYPEELLTDCPYLLEYLPENYKEEIRDNFVKMDFVGFNYYISKRTCFAADRKLKSKVVSNYFTQADQKFVPYPEGLLDVVLYIMENYDNPIMYITENGCATNNIYNKDKECEDDERIKYIRDHLMNVCRLIKVGANLKGYYYWNDADSYEEMTGYDCRFGLTWVDHNTGETKWKKSRYYFKEICEKKIVY